MGIEIPLAHAMVDRLLGFDRRLGESRLQLTPVEWGVWSFLILRARSIRSTRDRGTPRRARTPAPRRSDDRPRRSRPLRPDRSGAIVTVRWSVRLGNVAAAVRLWIAESVVQLWLATPPDPASAAIEPSSGSEVSNRRSSRISHQASAAGFRAPGAPWPVLWPCPKD